MKLKCTIGSARLKDSRRITQGEEFEVRGKEAQTLLAHRYAVKAVKTTTAPTPAQTTSDTDSSYSDDAPGDNEKPE